MAKYNPLDDPTSPESIYAAMNKPAPKDDLWTQKLPTSEYDEMTQPTTPTPAQAKVLGVPYVAPKVIVSKPPSYPERKLPATESDEMTQPTTPTPAQAKVLGVTVTSTSVPVQPPSYPQATAAPVAKDLIPGAPKWVNDTIKVSQIVATNAIKDFPSWYATENGKFNQPEKYQAELKAEFNAFEALPLWQKLLLHGGVVNPVMVDKDGIYSKYSQGEAPMVSLAGGIPAALRVAENGATKLRIIGAAEVGMKDAEYLRFLNARALDSSLTPERFKAVADVADYLKPFEVMPKGYIAPELNANLAEIQDAWNVAQKAKFNKIWNVIENGGQPKLTGSDFDELNLTKLQYDDMVTFLRSQQPVSYLRTITTEVSSVPVDKVIMDTGRYVAPALENVSKIVESSATPSVIVSTLISQGALSAALATAPHITLTVLNRVSQAQRELALSTTQPEISNAITGNQSVTVIQSIAQAEVNAQAQLVAGIQAMVNTASKVMTDSKTATKPLISPLFKDEVKVQPDIQTQVKTELNNQLQNVTDPAIRTQLQTYVQPVTDAATQAKAQTQTQTKTQTQTQTKTQTQAKTATENAVDTVTRTQTIKPTQIDRMGLKTPYKLDLDDSDKLTVEHEGKQIKLTHADAWLAWKQGIVYYLKWKPYDKAHTICTRTPIAGVPYVAGIGSAAKSIVARYGEVPEALRFDMGIVDVSIVRGSDPGKPLLTYTLDRWQAGRIHRKARKSQSGIITVRSMKNGW
jgi:hypothetical protein